MAYAIPPMESSFVAHASWHESKAKREVHWRVHKLTYSRTGSMYEMNQN